MAQKQPITKKQQTSLFGVLLTLLVALGGYYFNEGGASQFTPTAQLQFVDNGSSIQARTPDEALAQTVMTTSVVKQLGGDLRWNGAGAYEINGNKTKLNADVASQPYATNKTKSVQGQTVPVNGNALLSKSTRQYQKRDSSYVNWEPAGWHQVHDLPGEYDHAVDRGHLLGYALVGGLSGFDASTSNPDNVAVQTAWANQAADSDSTGQNYYETLVRKALDKNKRVRYRVTLIYEGDNYLIASGTHLEAKSSDGTLEFNVFVPNVQSGLTLNYLTGEVLVNQ